MDKRDKGSLNGDAQVFQSSTIEKVSNTADFASESTSPSDSSKIKTSLSATSAPEALTGFKLTAVLIAVTMVAFLVILDLSVIVTAIPKITTQFHSTADIGWYGSAYLLSNCSIQPLSGKIYKHFNSKIVFLSFLALFEVGSLICGVAANSQILIIGRAVAGMGGAGLVNGALTILSSCVALEKRALVIGIMGGCANIANVLGPFIGGSLTQYATWRWCFFINLPSGFVVAIILFIITIPQSVSPLSFSSTTALFTTLDIPGFLIFTPGIIMFLLALEWGGSMYAWNSAVVIGLFVGCVPFFVGFWGWERYKGEEAMVPLNMFRNKVVALAAVVNFFAMGALLVSVFYMPVWFQAVQGKSPTISGASLLPMVGAQILGAVGGGLLISKIGYYLPVGIVGLGIGAIGCGLLTTLLPDSSVASWVGFEILTGIRGLALQIPLIAMQNNLAPQNIAIGNSILIFLQNFGGTLMLSFAQLIFTRSLTTNMEIYAPGVRAEDVLMWGATGFRNKVGKDLLGGVLVAYDKAVVATLWLAVAAMLAAWACNWGLGWKNVKAKKRGGERGVEEGEEGGK